MSEKFFFKIIDNLNRNGAHTNPKHVKQNIKNFLENICREHVSTVLSSNSRGVDVGAGYGLLSEVLESYGIMMYNLDKYPPKDGLGNQIIGRAESLPFKDESLDFATVFYSFNHFDNPNKAFDELYRVVRKNGHMIMMMDFQRYNNQEYFIRLNELSMNKIIYKNNNDFTSNIINTGFDKKEFETMISEHNLNTVLKKDFPATKFYDKIFKTAKYLYILEKH